MEERDIPQVVEIDRFSFAWPWSERTYRYELTQRHNSTFLVVTVPEAELPPDEDENSDPGGIRERIERILHPKVTTGERVVGYSGFWHITDEAHVSTIAVHPQYRGRGLGEMLFGAMVDRAIELNCKKVTLEVRVSNERAMRLYHKYEFEIVNRRKNYYRDNNEDAWIMLTETNAPGYRKRQETRLEALYERVHFDDRVRGLLDD
jgi:ribosomal-protein-alanine N-acetyltransferase